MVRLALRRAGRYPARPDCGSRLMQAKNLVSLIGAPTDIGAGHRGASMGPEALRVAGIAEALIQRGIDVVDRGNLIGPMNPWIGPVEGYRHLAQVQEWNRLVMQAV